MEVGYYRIMLGKGSKYAKECLDGGFIGTDFGLNIDLTTRLPDNWSEFNKEFVPIYLELYPEKPRTAAGLACGAIHTVSKGMLEGDIVLSPDGTGQYLVGEIVGSYSYLGGGILPHRREVRWYKQSILRSDMSEKLRNSTGSIGTVSNITKYTEELEQLIKSKNTAKLVTSSDLQLIQLFHNINSVLPENQELLTISPKTPVIEAFNLMNKYGYSQLPVIIGQATLGFFSWESFAKRAVNIKDTNKLSLKDRTVEEFIETPKYVRLQSEFVDAFDDLDSYGAVFVGDDERVHGILTPMDLLRYLNNVVSPFVLIAEIEGAVRSLIHSCVDEDELVMCCKESLKSKYKEDNIPATIEDMSFNDYAQIVGYTKTWNLFKPAFGGTVDTTRQTLTELGKLRNIIFHFRRDLTIEEIKKLSDDRNWVLRRIKIVIAQANHKI